MADIYGQAEDYIVEFRHKLLALNEREEELNGIQALTKWMAQLLRITRSIVNENIERSLRRMGVLFIYY